MEGYSYQIKDCVFRNNTSEIINLLNSGLDPDFEGGWPIRFAARRGSYSIVKTLIQYGANPHLLGCSGASTLQLAVYSGLNWESDNWSFLLAYCDSSQLADGAAIAIIFQNIEAFKKIISTGRCNTTVPTSLTGRTVESLAKAYNLHYILTRSITVTNQSLAPNSPRNLLNTTLNVNTPRQPQSGNQRENLSPSVARFFHQTAASLIPQHTSPIVYPFQTNDVDTSVHNVAFKN